MKEFNWNKKNTVIAISIAVYAVIALLFVIVINNQTISAWVNNVLAVLSPVIIGGAIAYLSNPLVVFFDEKVYKRIKSPKVRRTLSMLCTYLLLALIITVILLIIIPQIVNGFNDFTKNLKSYTDKIITITNKLIYKFNLENDYKNLDNYINIVDLQKIVSDLFNTSTNFVSTLSGYIVSYASSIAVGIKNVIFGIIFSIYFLAAKESLLANARKISTALLSEKNYATFSEMVKFTHKAFGDYIRAQLLDAVLVAIECMIIFSLCKMPYSVLLAFIIGITNIIPVFGPFIGGIPAAFIVFVTSPEKLLLFVILIVLIQQIDGNFILPRLVGTSTGMSALGVLFAITVMGGYFGIAGMILGVPFFVVTSEIIRRLVNAQLEKRGLTVSIADYYPTGSAFASYVNDPPKEHLIVRIVNAIGNFFKRIFNAIGSFFKRIFKKKN